MLARERVAIEKRARLSGHRNNHGMCIRFTELEKEQCSFPLHTKVTLTIPPTTAILFKLCNPTRVPRRLLPPLSLPKSMLDVKSACT